MPNTWRASVALAAAGLWISLAAGAAPFPLLDSLDLSFDDGMGNSMVYRLYLPEGYDSSKEYPLVLYMHGNGAQGTDNVSQLGGIDGLINATRTAAYESFLLAPQLPTGGFWGAAVDVTDDILAQTLDDYSVDLDRVYATGVSLGGVGTYALLARSPDAFAAAAPVAAAGVVSTAPLFAHVPIWAFHGELDPIIPLSAAQAMIDALVAAGGSPIFTVFPGAGHSLPGVYDDPALYDWMFSQSLPEPGPLALGALAGLWAWRRSRPGRARRARAGSSSRARAGRACSRTSPR